MPYSTVLFRMTLSDLTKYSLTRSIARLPATAELLVTQLGKMTDADKVINSQHFGRGLSDVWIRINPAIWIGILDQFWLKCLCWWRFALLEHSLVVVDVGSRYQFRVVAVYSNHDNKHGPNSARVRLRVNGGRSLRAPQSAPVIVKVFAISASSIVVRWQVPFHRLTLQLFSHVDLLLLRLTW